MGQTITNITTKVRVDSKKNAYGVMDGAKDYVSADSNKFFHVVRRIFPRFPMILQEPAANALAYFMPRLQQDPA